MVNVYTPERYDERIVHLALGIEPIEANSGLRAPSSVDVRIEQFPRPVHEWRTWRPGETLSPYLRVMPRRETGRFALLYHQRSTTTIPLRLVDNLRSRLPGANPGRFGVGQGRRIVPRRVSITIPAEAAVLAAEADPATPPVPIWQRTFPLGCFPGATAALPPGATVIRGRIERDDGTGRMVPVRWARVRGANAADDDIGWAHGDDRGEFVLVIGRSDNDIVSPPDPLAVTLSVGHTDPPPTPDPADPHLATIDPFWDLPVETVTAAVDPATEPSITGRRFLPGQSVVAPVSPAGSVDVPHGREISVVVVLP